MKTNILKCGIASAALVAGLIASFTGCSGSTDTEEIIYSSSSAMPVPESYTPVAKPTLVSPIRLAGFDVVPNGDKTVFMFQGSALLDQWDTLAQDSTRNDPYFTGIILELARVTETGEKVTTPLNAYFTYNLNNQINFAAQPSAINFTEMQAMIRDPEKTECGHYRLIAYTFATNDLPGSPDYKEDKFVSIDSLDFDREEEYCVVTVIQSSSSEAIIGETVELEMVEGVLSNSNGYGFSFIQGIEVPSAEAQVTLNLTEEEELVLVGLNGYLVGDYSNDNDVINFDDDWSSIALPPNPAHMSDFRFNKAALSETYEGFENSRFYVVVGPNFNQDTGEDFYALTLKEKQNKDANGVMKATVIYYRKK